MKAMRNKFETKSKTFVDLTISIIINMPIDVHRYNQSLQNAMFVGMVFCFDY